MLYVLYAILMIIAGITQAPKGTELLYFGMAMIMLILSDIDKKLKRVKLFYFKGDKEGEAALVFGDVERKKENDSLEDTETTPTTICLECGEIIQDDKDTCDECGWTWKV